VRDCELACDAVNIFKLGLLVLCEACRLRAASCDTATQTQRRLLGCSHARDYEGGREEGERAATHTTTTLRWPPPL
jgi:hypothetical protein